MAQAQTVSSLRSQRRWFVGGVALLALHLALGIARIPDRVFARRAADIARYREEGAARFLLGNARLGGADVIEWLQRRVKPGDCVLWRGDSQGAMEFVPALLAPVVVVAETAVPAGAAHYRNRPLLRAELPDGRAGVVVVVGRRDALALEVR
jgi:hypothetical protein